MPSALKVRAARALKQLELGFPPNVVAASRCEANCHSGSELRAGHDVDLELAARELLRSLGANELARKIRVEWNPRLKTIAGRADYREKLISLNPLLRNVDNGLAQTESGVGKLDRWSRSSLTSDSGHKLDCLKQSSFASTSWNSRHAAIVCDEVDRTLRHELAHLLAQWRTGRRRIAPHGPEWRDACVDLGIADEARCHNLPFATKVYPARFVYRCPN